VLAALYKLMRTASIVICAIVVVSFLIFALDQTKTASGQQQSALRNGSSGGPSAEGTPKQHKNGFHQAIDDTASTFTSPFTGIVSASKSEWATRWSSSCSPCSSTASGWASRRA
jgi:hypothetical protein